MKTETIAIDDLLARLGNDFRGLWTSCEIDSSGRITKGWSVTFTHQIYMVETPYQKTAHKALEFAIKLRDGWADGWGEKISEGE